MLKVALCEPTANEKEAVMCCLSFVTFLPFGNNIVVRARKEVVFVSEAIIFALLGYLRLNNKNNCLSSVTGAHHDNCGGDIAGISYINQ
jgi:hypothetical protein